MANVVYKGYLFNKVVDGKSILLTANDNGTLLAIVEFNGKFRALREYSSMDEFQNVMAAHVGVVDDVNTILEMYSLIVKQWEGR